MNLADMTEDQAIELFYDMRRRFHWTGVLVVPNDLRETFMRYEEREPTDAEMEHMRTCWSYRKMDEWLDEYVYAALWDMVCDAKREATA